MKNYSLFVLSFLIMLPIINPATAEEVDIAALKIFGLHQNDKKGLYDKITNAVGSAANYHFKVKTMSPKRAFKDFKEGRVTRISPANSNANFYNFSFPTIETTPMGLAKVYIFTKPVSILDNLKGKPVGIRKGMPYGKKVESSGLNFTKNTTIISNIRAVQENNLHAFIAYWPDVYAAFNKLGIEKFPHIADKPISVHDDSILCRKTILGEKIVNEFNKGYRAIKNNGTLAILQ